jgi:outer membrane protein insertion porin family
MRLTAGYKSEGLYSISEKELLYLLEIEEGKALEPAAVRRGIKRAFMKGIFEDISVVADEEQKGLLTVKVRERKFISKIVFKGNTNVSSRFIRKHLGLNAGDEMRYDHIETYREKVLDVVRQKGYPDVSVSVEVERARKPNKVKLIFRLKEGRPLYIRDVQVLGKPATGVLNYMRISRGSVYDQFRVRKDIEKLTARYKKMEYLNPVVGPYTFSDGVLHLNVNPGKRLSIKVRGNDSVGRKKLTVVMPFFDAGDIRDDLIDEAISRMTDVYHARGFSSVQIATVISRDGDDVTLNFYFYEGPKIKVKAINISGITVPGESLKKIISLREKSPYNPNLLKGDARAIEDFYNALGYINALVSEPEVVIEDSLATINIDVVEGRQVLLTGTVLEGAISIPGEDIYREVGLEVGAPYNEVDISDARRRVIGLYRDKGFQDVSVDVERRFDEADGVAVVFKVSEGRKMYFGKTLITGNPSTKLKVVQRELEHKEGDPLDKTLLLGARQRVYKTGLFSDVNIDLLQRYGDRADVVVDVKEGKAGAFEFGLGYGEYDRFRGFFDLSYKKLFGMNRQVSFRTEMSSLVTRYILRYGEPWFLGRRTPIRAYMIRENRKEINIDTGNVKYKVKRYTTGIGVEEKISERVRFDLLYEFSYTETTDVDPGIILSKEDTGTLAISSITPSLSFDTRDNPFDPKRGVYAGVSLKTATALLASETDFFKLVGFGSIFKDLSRRVVVAVSVRSGLAQGIRDTTDLPLIERFFLGGRSTVRGFSQDSLGPKDPQGTPIGGNVFFLGNLELRLGITKNWRIVPFFDTGAVWIDDGDVDFTDLRYTAGLGLQFNTPVGPVRFDYGHKLDRRADESKGEFHFSIGYAF